MPNYLSDKTCAADPAQHRCAKGWPFKTIRRYAALLLLAVFVSACMPKPATVPPASIPTPPEAETIDTGEGLFERAEELLAKNLYPDALANYKEYLTRFPDGPLAEIVLFRTIYTYLKLENTEDATAAYARLIDHYPDSVFAPEIGMELLVALSNAGEYAKLIEQAPAINEKRLTDSRQARKYLLLGNAYLAMGFPVDAISICVRAIATAPAEENALLWIKLKNAVTQLNTSEIIYLLGQYEDHPPAGYLMFQLGLNKIIDRQYEDAVVILSSYLEKFPDHEIALQARQLLAELKNTFIYEQFTIGCLLPLSGRYKAYGLRALNAIAFALSQVTPRNPNPLIKIVVKDTGADPDKTMLAMEALINQKVAAIIGPMIHVERPAVKAQESGIPIIILTQKDQIVEMGDYVFRNFFTPRMQVKSLVSYAVKDLELNRFAILYPDERYGSTYMNLFWDEVLAQDGVVVGVESYDPKQTDFADPIKKLVGLYYEVPEYLKPPVDLTAEMLIIDSPPEKEVKNTGRNKTPEGPRAIVDFDAVFIPDSPKKAGLVIPQLAFYDISDVYLLGTNLWNSKELIKMAHQYVQAAIIPDGFFAESESKKVKTFTGLFQEIYNQPPGYIEAISYDTAMILFQLTNLPEIRSRAELKEALLNLKNYEGITGLTSFKENGDVEKELYLLRIRGEKFIELKRDRDR